MLTQEQAIALVKDTLPSDQDIVQDATIERDYGWVIFFQTKRYIETKNIADALCGPRGVLVEKSTARLISFSSAFATETSLAVYEAGYLDHPDFDIVVKEVADIEAAATLLRLLNITYVKPEFAHGETWRIPTPYSIDRLLEMLRTLPCRFNLGSVYLKWKSLELVRQSRAIEFELTPNNRFRNEI